MPGDPTPAPVAKDDTPMIIYILYLSGFAAGGIPSLIGVIMAYVNRADAAPWAQTHYRFQIRTFWIGFLYGFVSIICLFVIIGIPMLIFVVVWLIIRCAKGIKASSNSQPHPNVETWWW